MTGRIPFGLLLSLTVLASWPILAQDQVGPPPGYYGMPPAGAPTMQSGAAPGYWSAGSPGPQVQGPPPRMVYEQLPDNIGFGDPDTPLGNWLTTTFQHGWFRGEYLLWSISAPGNTVLGEQTSTGVPNLVSQGGGISGSNVISIQNPVTTATININGGPATIPISGGVIFGTTANGVTAPSQSPSLDNTSFNGLSGFRGTFGLPLPGGGLELGAFFLGSATSTFNGNNLITPQITGNPASAIGSQVGTNGLPATNDQPGSFIAQALLVNGVPQAFSVTSSSFLVYDVSYQYKMTTQAWGSEVNWVGDSNDPNGFFLLKPIIGFRYFNYRDSLDQRGQYNQANPTDPTAPPTVVTRTIYSGSNNNLYGPQAGLRMELANSSFCVGFEPKLMLGLNTYSQQLNTANILSSTDPAQSILQNTTTFSPMVDLKFYTNVALSHWVSWYLSYNFLYVADVNRSFNDVVYNKNSVKNQSDFSLQKTMNNVTLQGLSVGFDVRW